MTAWNALFIVVITMLAGSAVYLYVARRSPVGGRSDQTPTNVYAVTAGAMSLLIAFTLSMTYNQYQAAQTAVSQEADAIYTMNRAAQFMRPDLRDQLRDQLVCYAEQVIDVEWPMMEKGQTVWAPEVRQTVTKMDTILMENADAAGVGLSMWQSANAQRLAAHQARMLVAGDGVPIILWLLLILGSVITVVSLFVYADRSKPGWGHVLVIIGPLFIASAALVVIAFFDHPYAKAPGSIGPEAMQTMLTNLENDQVGDARIPSCPSA